MAKTFHEALPGFNPSEEIQDILEYITIDRVTMSRTRNIVSIYITCSRLIPKKLIYRLEGEIKKQFFHTKETLIKVIENYRLPDTYNASYIMQEYKDSLVLELTNYNRMIADMFRHGTCSLEEEGYFRVEIADNLVTRNKAPELEKILHKVFNERFHLAVQIKIIYVDEQKETREEKESFIEHEVERIREANHNTAEAKSQKEEEKDENTDDKSAKSGSEDMASKKTSDKNHQNKDKKQKEKVNKGKDFDKKEFKGKEFKAKTFQNPDSNAEYQKPADSSDVIYGRNFDGTPVELKDVDGELGEIVVNGEIMDLEMRELRSGNTMCIFHIYDGTDSIGVKAFVRAEAVAGLKEILKAGIYVAVKGIASLDTFDHEIAISSVRGIKKATAPAKHKRMDNAPVKRVELHCHTKFSEMDAVSDVKELMKTVYDWGMPALALTDHGNVQAFTEAFHLFDKTKNLKLLYGMEGYLVDDLITVVENPGEHTLKDDMTIVSMKTTGINNKIHKILEIGAVRVVDGVPRHSFHSFVNPEQPVSFDVEKSTGISDSMVSGAPKIGEVLTKFVEFSKGSVLVSHQEQLDIPFLTAHSECNGVAMEKPTVISTSRLARFFFPTIKKSGLEQIAKSLSIKTKEKSKKDKDKEKEPMRCNEEASLIAGIWIEFEKRLKERECVTLKDINDLTAPTPESIKKNPKYYHIILIAKNDLGRVNLYRLVSESHLNYFNRRPRIPKSLLIENREGIIIGSACEAGELYRALIYGADDARIAELCNFYDYLEIQPVGNNRFMFKKPELGVSCDEDIMNLNRRVYELGQIFHKPVVATCDSHFMKPEDAIYRAILQAGQGFPDADHQPPLYFRTTEEMLDEFRYLGDHVAEEIVIKNTNMIADMCEPIEPVRPDKCPPVIENSDKELREMCYATAKSIYGPDLPSIVTERLDKELNSIISNGYSVMYIIAQRLVKKSNDDGYLVGSRGSVGSSLAATMSGITEVNPLSPHYYCPNCHYNDFYSEDVKKFAGMAGCDMPDKMCPVCGQKLKKEGFDIPFETFLGFKGDKEPDIDLNFSGDYQAKAHAYTEVLFGKGHTFKAGTIGTVADKIAEGYVYKYYEERGIKKRRCEIGRISKGCVGVKRGTGQHPGGIIVMPHGEEIYSFTAIQHPANDNETNIITTHFDYHSIDHNLLKLDILGHDDPTMIRMLEDLLHIDAKTIPLDSKEVMSLFQSTKALGITPDDIDGCPLGTLGIPEFGTDFAMQMLIEAQPKYFSDLVRIAGLAHGTNVWLGNAQELIQQGTATIQTAICTRDDIMIYLISKGMDPEKSFKTMEKVRKGKGLNKDEEELMRQHNVPEWYIQSCQKIKYMFPKAHAAAYVMMAWRVAYCKIFHPLEYYTAYFSIRADMFSYEIMCMGRANLDRHIRIMREAQEKSKLSATEKVRLKDMRIVQEMYARGFEFVPIDLYKAKAKRFQVIDGKIMPSFMSIEGLGESVAVSIEEAAKKGRFLSLEDFSDRTQASSTIIALMKSFGIFGGIPDTNQLDFMSLIDEMDA